MNNALELDRLPLYGLFALVVKHQSFTLAAAETGLARSAVSQRVQRLEALVGAQLLRRTTRRVTPTEAGLRLYERCVPLLDHARAVEAGLTGHAGAPLRINAPASLVHAALGELLVQFTASTGRVIDLTLENRTIDLLETRDDLVVRVSRELPTGLVAKRLSQTRLLVVAAPAYLRSARPITAPQELVHHQCLRYRASPGSNEWRFGAGARTFSVPVDGPVIANDGLVLKRLCLQGVGLAVLPEFMIADELRAGSLEAVLTEHPRGMTVWAILPSGRRAPAPARALAAFLSKSLDRALPRA